MWIIWKSWKENISKDLDNEKKIHQKQEVLWKEGQGIIWLLIDEVTKVLSSKKGTSNK